MKKTKLLKVICVLMVAVIAITGCSSNEDAMTSYLQGALDSIYLGKADSEYLEFVRTEMATIEKNYIQGVKTEVDYMMENYAIGGTLSPEDLAMEERMLEFYKGLYSHSKYEVAPAEKGDNGSYSLKVTVEPVTLIADNIVEIDEILEEIMTVAFTSAEAIETEEEAFKIMNDAYKVYDETFITFWEEKLANTEISYGEPTEIVVQITLDSDDLYLISDNDMMNVDALILAY